MAKKEVAEYCPECENEVILQWDTEVDGFEATCPYCGNKLMLCDECQHTICEDGEVHDCDWCSDTKVCHRCKSEIAKEAKREQADFERRLLQKKAHERYKLYWCMTHGITIDEISRIADQWAENLGGGAEDYAPFRNYLEANGFFGSNIWPCRSEFVDCEYRDVSLMKSLLDPADFEKYLELEGEEHPDILGDTIKVETPHGTIVAKDQSDPDYPGVSLFFVPKGEDREHAGCVMEFNPTYHPNGNVYKTVPSVNLRIYERENPFGEPQQVLGMEPLPYDGFFYFVLTPNTVIAAKCCINWDTGEVSDFSNVMPIENEKSYANGAFVVEHGSKLLIPVIKVASEDEWRESGADPMKTLWRKEELTVPASFTSVWEGCNEISSDCRVNMDTREVFDIEVVDSDATEDVEVLAEQHITILSEAFQTYQKDKYEACSETVQQQSYWYH